LFNLKQKTKKKQKSRKAKEKEKAKRKRKKPRIRNPALTIPLDSRSLLAAGNRKANPTRERKERGKTRLFLFGAGGEAVIRSDTRRARSSSAKRNL